jgi:hypothetical protein
MAAALLTGEFANRVRLLGGRLAVLVIMASFSLVWLVTGVPTVRARTRRGDGPPVKRVGSLFGALESAVTRGAPMRGVWVVTPMSIVAATPIRFGARNRLPQWCARLVRTARSKRTVYRTV